MVSAAKLKRAQDAIVAARPYAGKMREVVQAVAGRAGQDAHPLLSSRERKKVALLAAALPLAVLANAGRVSTIVLIAEFVNAKFAGSTYHNWSGFVFFLLFGLSGLLLVSVLINGGLKKFKRKGARMRVVQKGAPG